MKIKSKATVVVIVALLGGIVIGRGCAGRHQHAEASMQGGEQKEAVVKFWTCSMHPQIKQPQEGKCPLCGMNLIPVMASGDADAPTSLRELKLSAAAIALADVETSLVERRFVTIDVRMVGKVEFDETRLAYLTAWVPGRLDRLYVDYTGVSVKKGDHMVSIYSPELIAAQEELLQAIDAVEDLKDSGVGRTQERAMNTVEASRDKLKLWGLTEAQIRAIESRGTADDHLTIYSPISGTVIHKNAQEGSYVTTGTRIYAIADLSRVWVKLDAYESDLAWLHYGQELSFETESQPGRVFRGTIAFIDPVLDEKTRTVKVRVNVDNAEGDLKPGMFVRATAFARIARGGNALAPDLVGKWISPMHPEIVKDGPGTCDICGMDLVPAETLGHVIDANAQAPLVIPASAALITGKRAVVYVRSQDDERVFEGREIVLGPRAGKYYLVQRGLREGEHVVTRGAFKLDAELQLNAKPSMMTPDGGGHDHGGPAPSGDAEHAGHGEAKHGMLTALSLRELHAVLSAATDAEQAVQKGDLSAVRSAFTVLSERVDAVSTEGLHGHAALLWKEYAMLLGNDGLEGGLVQTASEAQQVRALLQEHTESIRKTMGLNHKNAPLPMASTAPEFLAQLAPVFNDYLVLQAALAGDDSENAAAAAKQAIASLSAVDLALVSGEGQEAWLDQSAALQTSLTAILAAKDIAASRAQFAPLSEQLTSVVQRFGAPDTALYQFECPMALNGKGARWLQNDKATRNPYFGTSMLRCGSVIETLTGADKAGVHVHD
ncbi:MAG: efflux RND transporter periplasmic adaptor subunit [Kiritimatiellae bacterium]|nr:efflux RND transporter periplasmic adaptor subunit [Kiritimatiellia bacterium]